MLPAKGGEERKEHTHFSLVTDSVRKWKLLISQHVHCCTEFSSLPAEPISTSCPGLSCLKQIITLTDGGHKTTSATVSVHL